MEEYRMSDMDEQETIMNKSSRGDNESIINYDRAIHGSHAGKMRNLNILRGNTSQENVYGMGGGFGAQSQNVNNSSSNKDSIIH